MTRDLARDTSTLCVVKDLSVVTIDDIGLSVTRRAEETYAFADDDFESVRGETRWVMAFERADWRVETITHTVLTLHR